MECRRFAEERAARSEIDEEDSEPSSQMRCGRDRIGTKFEVERVASSAREHSHVFRDEVLVVENNVEK